MYKSKKYKQMSVDEFTRAANKYEGNHAGIYEMCKQDYPDILEEIDKEDFMDLLDAGCGPGPMISLLAEKYPDKHYTGIDLTPKMIEVASAKQIPSATFLVGDCEKLPFEENSFDIIICSQSFHHYPNPQDFFNSVKKVLRPGGRLILRDNTGPRWILWLINHIEIPLAHLVHHGDVKVYGKAEIERMCQKAGLHMEKFEQRKKFRMHCVIRKKEKIMELKLGDVQETALIPLAIRANETKRKNARICDEKAVEIIDTLGIDTKDLDKFFSHEGVVARTILFDEAVKKLLLKYPRAVCVNIGCGLDNRFSRVDNGKIQWFNIDLPDSIEVRKKIYKETEREHMIAGNVLELDWIEKIPRENIIIVIAEGLFMYFSKEQVRTILNHLTDAFGRGFLLVELMHPKMMKEDMHDTIKHTEAKFGWGTESGEELVSLDSKLALIKEISFWQEIKKYSLLGKVGSIIAGKLNNRLAIYKWK